MRKKITVTVLLSLLLSVTIAYAWILDDHVAQDDEILYETQSSPITQEIMQYKDYFYACEELTDISVIFYYLNGQEDIGFLEKLMALFSFNIGKQYRATHSVSSCLYALNAAQTQKERVCGYGICSHQVKDSVAHNNAVPEAIRKTKLWNGLVHSIKEIHDKNMFTDEQDRVYTREVLDLGYEMTPYLERVFINDPALSSVNIPSMVDFFITQVKGSSEYHLGFKSFFALPSYIYILIFLVGIISVLLLALSIRRLKDGQVNASTIATVVISLILLGLSVTVIYGLLSSNVWSYWEKLSQFIFSPSMYFIAVLLLVIGVTIFLLFLKSKKIPDLFTALFILLFAFLFFFLPSGLDTGTEERWHQKSIDMTKEFMNQGVSYIQHIPDPVGYEALREAEQSGDLARNIFMLLLVILLFGILYYTFRKKKT